MYYCWIDPKWSGVLVAMHQAALKTALGWGQRVQSSCCSIYGWGGLIILSSMTG
jgi:hypothetical protein